MDTPKINVLISSIAGLGLASTIVLPINRTATAADLWTAIIHRFAINFHSCRYILSTHRNNVINPTCTASVASFAGSESADMLSLRLWAPLCGGKGGFGSQLRAAGGRMSSRKKRDGEDNGSSRNLSGRRIRTVNEAKALAEYLSMKPEMNKRQKEQRRERLEKIVEIAEKRVDEIKNGGKGRLDEKWIEDKKEAAERARLAVMEAMKANAAVLGTSQGSRTSTLANTSEEDDVESSRSDSSAEACSSSPKATEKPKAFFGFDDDDEFMSSDDE